MSRTAASKSLSANDPLPTMTNSSNGNNAEHRYELFFPRTLGVFTRMRIWLHGYFDALRGKIEFSPEGYITSPYCRHFEDEANYRINAEWQECNGAMFELRPELLRRIGRRDEIRRRISLLPEQHLKTQL